MALLAYSADEVKKSDDAYAAPTELLNSFNDIEGLPQHKLTLKKNMPIMCCFATSRPWYV